jgi:hypothetical protein
LRWRQAEYQALLALPDASKSRVVPLITIPAIEFDFETNTLKRNAHQHVFPFPKRFKKKWGTRPAWIDVDPTLHAETMNDGEDIYTFVFDGLRAAKAAAVPVVTLAAPDNVKSALRTIVTQDARGIALRARFEDIMRPTFTSSARAILSEIGVDVAQTDLILDLGSPNYEPYDAFAGALGIALKRLGNLANYRNVVLVGTAIPESLGDVGKEGAMIPRHDWAFYKTFVAKLPDGIRRPNYGDYTIVHPSFLAMDMRMVKSAGKVVYATANGQWAIWKGGAFRPNPEQMHDHCAEIVASPHFLGKGFSYGDDYIADCAVKAVSASNLTQWKKVAINHHMALLLSELATLTGAP